MSQTSPSAATTLGRRLATLRAELNTREQWALDAVLDLASRPAGEVTGYDAGNNNTDPTSEWCNAFVSESPQLSPGINLGAGIPQNGVGLSAQRRHDRP